MGGIMACIPPQLTRSLGKFSYGNPGLRPWPQKHLGEFLVAKTLLTATTVTIFGKKCLNCRGGKWYQGKMILVPQVRGHFSRSPYAVGAYKKQVQRY